MTVGSTTRATRPVLSSTILAATSWSPLGPLDECDQPGAVTGHEDPPGVGPGDPGHPHVPDLEAVVRDQHPRAARPAVEDPQPTGRVPGRLREIGAVGHQGVDHGLAGRRPEWCDQHLATVVRHRGDPVTDGRDGDRREAVCSRPSGPSTTRRSSTEPETSRPRCNP